MDTNSGTHKHMQNQTTVNKGRDTNGRFSLKSKITQDINRSEHGSEKSENLDGKTFLEEIHESYPKESYNGGSTYGERVCGSPGCPLALTCMKHKK